MMNGTPLTLPDLGLDNQPIVLTLWLVKRGSRVAEGEPLVEVLAGSGDGRSSVAGRRHSRGKSAAAGDVLAVGQQLADDRKRVVISLTG